MNDLLEAVEALTRIRHVQIDTDDGPRWVTGEPRLIQLQEAITSTMGNGEGSLTCYDHDGTCCPCGTHDMGRGEWQVHRARAALLAAQEVRRG